VYPKIGGEENWFAVTVVVESKLLLGAVDAMRKSGATDITVTSLRYVFESKSWTFEALRRRLTGEEAAEAVGWS
jgi:hypothetical protein